MKKLRLLFVSLFLIVVAGDQALAQRWIQYKTLNGVEAYQPVDWDSIAAVVFLHRGNQQEAYLYILSDGTVRQLGTVAGASDSHNRLRALITAQPNRWVKMWPDLNGALLRPADAEGFADLKKITALAEGTPIDTGGLPTWFVGFPGLVRLGGVVEDSERARIRRMIDESMNP